MKLEKLRANDKIISKASYQSLQTTKMNFEKLLSEQVFKNHNCHPFQSSSSLSTRASFVFAVSFIPSSIFLRCYFMFPSIWWRFLMFEF